jgi:hypothetical protein
MSWEITSRMMIGDPSLIYDANFHFIEVDVKRGTWESEVRGNTLYVYHEEIKNLKQLKWKKEGDVEEESGRLMVCDSTPVLEKTRDTKFKYVDGLEEECDDFLQFEHGIIMEVLDKDTDLATVFYPVYVCKEADLVSAIKIDFSLGKENLDSSDSNPEM